MVDQSFYQSLSLLSIFFNVKSGPSPILGESHVQSELLGFAVAHRCLLLRCLQHLGSLELGCVGGDALLWMVRCHCCHG